MVVLKLTPEEAAYIARIMGTVMSDFHWTSKVREIDFMYAQAIHSKIAGKDESWR